MALCVHEQVFICQLCSLILSGESENYTILYVHTPGRLRDREYNNRCNAFLIVHKDVFMYMFVSHRDYDMFPFIFNKVIFLSFLLRLLCRWNIQCPQNQLMYLDMDEHIIEPPENSTFFTVSIESPMFLYEFQTL